MNVVKGNARVMTVNFQIKLSESLPGVTARKGKYIFAKYM